MKIVIRVLRFALVICVIGLSGCSTVGWMRDGWNEWKNDSPEKPEPTPNEFPDNSVWLNYNISKWPVTATISSVDVSGRDIKFPYSHANKWPGHPTVKARDGGDINGNVWVVAQPAGEGGTWYMVTWEWLRVGQQSKPKAAFNNEHIKRREFNNWKPKSGEKLGFMVSGFARDNNRTVEERSNVVWVRWP